jgi:hypothetical protein
MRALSLSLGTVDNLQIPNIQFPPAKVLYGGQVEQGLSNDEVFSSLPFGIWQHHIPRKIQPKDKPAVFLLYSTLDIRYSTHRLSCASLISAPRINRIFPDPRPGVESLGHN